MAGNDRETQRCQRCNGSGQVIQDRGYVRTNEKGKQETYTVQVPVTCGGCGGSGKY